MRQEAKAPSQFDVITNIAPNTPNSGTTDDFPYTPPVPTLTSMLLAGGLIASYVLGGLAVGSLAVTVAMGVIIFLDPIADTKDVAVSEDSATEMVTATPEDTHNVDTVGQVSPDETE